MSEFFHEISELQIRLAASEARNTALLEQVRVLREAILSARCEKFVSQEIDNGNRVLQASWEGTHYHLIPSAHWEKIVAAMNNPTQMRPT